jgi:hypothetical protein
VRRILIPLVALVTFLALASSASAITTSHCQNALLGTNADGAVTHDNDIRIYVNNHYEANGVHVNSWQWWSRTHPQTQFVTWTLRFNLATGQSNLHSFACDAGGDGIIEAFEDWLVS